MVVVVVFGREKSLFVSIDFLSIADDEDDGDDWNCFFAPFFFKEKILAKPNLKNTETRAFLYLAPATAFNCFLMRRT